MGDPGAARRDDLIYDVGMHRGEDTAYYLAKGYRVAAFEANPDLVALCRRRFAAALADERLEIFEGAIGDDGETVRFYRHPERTEWGTMDYAWVERVGWTQEAETVEVPTVSMPATLRATGAPYYMKIDVEGADTQCLEALRELPEKPKFVSVEAERWELAAFARQVELLSDLGYERFATVQQKQVRERRIDTADRSGRKLRFTFEPGASGPFGEDLEAEWLDRRGILRRHRRLLRSRSLWEARPFASTNAGRHVRRRLELLLNRALPGWYDVHAR